MAKVNRKKNLRYNVFNPDQLDGIYPAPIVSNARAPGTSDLADLGAIWIDTSADNAYILVSITGNSGTWQTLADIPTAGTDGQLWIGATGAAAAWNNITSTGLSVTITNTANGINLEAAGVAALTSLDSDSGTATPIAGVIDVLGGLNLNTAAVAGTLTVHLDASPSVTGSITAGEDFTMTAGTCTITSDTAAGDDIYLHADAGVGETIHLYADQGTGTDSIHLESDDGGITIDAGLAAANSIIIDASAAGGGIDMDCGTGGFSLTATNGTIALISGTAAITVGTDATAHEVTIGSVTTTAGTTIQSGTGDLVLTSTDEITLDAAGILELNSSASTIGIGNDAVAQAINVGTGAAQRLITIGNVSAASGVVIDCGTGDLVAGASATAHNSTFGSTTATSDTVIQSGTGNTSITSTGDVTVDAAGVLELNSSAGIIGIGNDAVAQNMNFGTGAAQRDIVIGNATGTTSVTINAGTGGTDISTNAIANTTTIGNATGASSVVVNGGTGIMTFGSNAIAHAVTLGSATGAAATTLQAGTAALTIDGLGLINIDAAGVLSINSDGAAINIGNDADAFAVNICTGAAGRDLTLGSSNTSSTTTIEAGSGGIVLTPILGLMTAAPLEVSVAGVALTASGNLGSCTFTGQTTAAGAEQEFTITNTICTTASVFFVTATNVSAADCQMTVTRVEPKAGSFVVTLTNNGAAALDANVLINFWLIKP